MDFEIGDLLVIRNASKIHTGEYVNQPEPKFIIVRLDQDMGSMYPQEQFIALDFNYITNITSVVNSLTNI